MEDPLTVLRQDLGTAIQELRLENQALRARLEAIQHPTSSRPKPALPDPEKFTGHTLKFDTWLPSIKAKLRVDHAAIGDSIAQFYYVYLNLDSSVQAMVLPQLAQAEESGVWNYNSILDQLARVHDNPNKIIEAEDKLHHLKQGSSESVAAYIAKFERVLYEARGQDWPDASKISTFRQGLSSSIRSRLAQQLNLPRTYEDFLRIVQQLASNSSYSSTPHASQPARQERHDPMDLNQIQLNTLEVLPSSPRAPSISSVQREKYRQEGRCVRCGSSDHWVENCRFHPHSPNPYRRRQTAKRIPASNQGSDDDTDVSEIWKESYKDLLNGG